MPGPGAGVKGGASLRQVEPPSGGGRADPRSPPLAGPGPRLRRVLHGIAQALITRLGVKPVMATGLARTAFAYLWYTQLPPDGTFWRNLFVPWASP